MSNSGGVALAGSSSAVDSLLPVPFNAPLISAGGTGGGSQSIGGAGAVNPDGTGNRVILTMTNAGVPGNAAVFDVVYGPDIGVRWVSSQLATLFPFDMEIDGVPYAIDAAAYRTYNVTTATGVALAQLVLARGLSNGRHTVKVSLVAETLASAAAKRLELYGWLAAAGYGNVDRPQTRGGSINTPTLLPLAATAIPFNGLSAGLHFFNTDAAARTVTVLEPTGTAYWVRSIPATSSDDLTFQVPQTSLSGWKWSANAANVVNGMAVQL